MQVAQTTPPNTEGIKRKRGRPKGTTKQLLAAKGMTFPGNPPPEVTAQALKDLPRPPKWLYRQKDAADFFKYWRGLSVENRELVSVYIYRNYPVIDVMLTAPPGTKPGDGPAKYQKVLTEPMSEEYDADLLHMLGWGDYTLYLKQGSKEICRLQNYSTERDSNHPPILDINQLVRTDPKNQAYIEGLRQRNVKLPWEESTGEEDMNVATTQNLTDTIKELATRQIPPPPQPRATADEVASSSALAVMKEAATFSAKLVSDAADRASDKQTTASNPLEIVESIAKLATIMSSNKAPDTATPMLVEVMKQNSELNRRLSEQQQEHTRELITMMKRENPNINPASLPQPKSLADTLNELKDVKSVMQEFMGITPAETEDEDGNPLKQNGNGKANTINLILAALPAVGQLVTGLVQGAVAVSHNLAIARGAANPDATPTPPTMPMPQAPIGMQPTPSNGQPTPVYQQAYTPTSPQVPLTPEQEQLRTVHLLLEKITPSFLHHFKHAELNGADFAHWFIHSDENGRLIYDQLVEGGKDQIWQVIQTYPPLWGQVHGYQLRLGTFLDEMLDYDNLYAQDEADDGDNLTPVQ